MNDTSFIANGGNFTFPDKANVRPERLFFRLPLDRLVNQFLSHWHAGYPATAPVTHDAVIRVYDKAGNVIEMREQRG